MFVYLLCVDWLNTCFIFCLSPSRFSFNYLISISTGFIQLSNVLQIDYGFIFYVQVMSSYDELRKKNLEIGPFVEWHFNKILKNIQRSLKIKQSFRNPFQFKLKEPILFYLFSHIYHAIKTYQGEATPPSILFSTITDKPG